MEHGKLSLAKLEPVGDVNLHSRIFQEELVQLHFAPVLSSQELSRDFQGIPSSRFDSRCLRGHHRERDFYEAIFKLEVASRIDVYAVGSDHLLGGQRPVDAGSVSGERFRGVYGKLSFSSLHDEFTILDHFDVTEVHYGLMFLSPNRTYAGGPVV